MKYTIQYKDSECLFYMNGKGSKYVGDHLYDIAKENGITTAANSESHHLHIIVTSGIDVELIEEDGSRMIW